MTAPRRSDWQDAFVDPDLAPDGARVLLTRIERTVEEYFALYERLAGGAAAARSCAGSIRGLPPHPDGR